MLIKIVNCSVMVGFDHIPAHRKLKWTRPGWPGKLAISGNKQLKVVFCTDNGAVSCPQIKVGFIETQTNRSNNKQYITGTTVTLWGMHW